MTKDRGYTDHDLREVADNPEWTDEGLATAKPLAQLLSQLGPALRAERSRRRPSESRVTIELDTAVVDRFKATGEGWEARIGEVLRRAAGL